MFGDMMHIGISTQDNGDYCQATDNLNDATTDFCAQGATDSYIRMLVNCTKH